MRDLIAGATVHLAAGSPKPALLLDCDRAEEQVMPERSAVLHLGLCPARGAREQILCTPLNLYKIYIDNLENYLFV